MLDKAVLLGYVQCFHFYKKIMLTQHMVSHKLDAALASDQYFREARGSLRRDTLRTKVVQGFL